MNGSEPNPDGSGSWVVLPERDPRRYQLLRTRAHLLSGGRAGLCPTVDAAILALFPNSSRNPRYKNRNFTRFHQRLDGLLAFPEAIGERLGAEVAQALKGEREGPLVGALKARAQGVAEAAGELALPRG